MCTSGNRQERGGLEERPTIRTIASYVCVVSGLVSPVASRCGDAGVCVSKLRKGSWGLRKISIRRRAVKEKERERERETGYALTPHKESVREMRRD